jgi:hypothetical protein
VKAVTSCGVADIRTLGREKTKKGTTLRTKQLSGSNSEGGETFIRMTPTANRCSGFSWSIPFQIRSQTKRKTQPSFQCDTESFTNPWLQIEKDLKANYRRRIIENGFVSTYKLLKNVCGTELIKKRGGIHTFSWISPN